MKGLFNILINKLKPQYNEIVTSLQFHKLVRQMNENAEELMARLHLTAVECNYKEIYRQLMSSLYTDWITMKY